MTAGVRTAWSLKETIYYTNNIFIIFLIEEIRKYNGMLHTNASHILCKNREQYRNECPQWYHWKEFFSLHLCRKAVSRTIVQVDPLFFKNDKAVIREILYWDILGVLNSFHEIDSYWCHGSCAGPIVTKYFMLHATTANELNRNCAFSDASQNVSITRKWC